MIVPAVRTGGTPGLPWARSRYAALLLAWRSRGLPWPEARRLAAGVLPHLVRETGWGRAEWDYDPGNIKCAGYGLCQRLPDGQTYRAYLTLGGGVEAYVRLLEAPRYRGALAYLLATGDGRGWYERLVRAGYSTNTPAALVAASSDYASIARRLGAV